MPAVLGRRRDELQVFFLFILMFAELPARQDAALVGPDGPVERRRDRYGFFSVRPYLFNIQRFESDFGAAGTGAPASAFFVLWSRLALDRLGAARLLRGRLKAPAAFSL